MHHEIRTKSVTVDVDFFAVMAGTMPGLDRVAAGRDIAEGDGHRYSGGNILDNLFFLNRPLDQNHQARLANAEHRGQAWNNNDF